MCPKLRDRRIVVRKGEKGDWQERGWLQRREEPVYKLRDMSYSKWLLLKLE